MGTLVKFAVVLLLATPALADDRVLGIGAHVGYSEASDAEDGTAIYGGDLSIRGFSLIGALIEVGYRQDDVEVNDPTGTIRDAELEMIPILASLQVFPFADKLGPFNPFAIGGVGWYVTRAEVDARVGEFEGSFTDHDVSTGYHFGGGTDLNLGDHLTLTGDIRYVFLETDLEDVDDVDADGIRMTAGVKFFF
ncbi:MAG: outer membrane beta-barrel protein [Candidatus Binatia bacterium]